MAGKPHSNEITDAEKVSESEGKLAFHLKRDAVVKGKPSKRHAKT